VRANHATALQAVRKELELQGEEEGRTLHKLPGLQDICKGEAIA